MTANRQEKKKNIRQNVNLRYLLLNALCAPWFSAAVLCLLVLYPLVTSAATWSPNIALETYLKDNYPWAEVEVSDLRLSAAQPSRQPDAIFVEKSPPGRSEFRFEYKNGKSVTVTALVKAFDRVLMSRGAFRKGYMITQDDIYPTLMETTRIPRGAVREDSLVIGKPLFRSIVPNVPITDAMVSDATPIKRGRRVVIAVDSPGFSIKALGEITHDAKIGDYVKVVNILSKKVMAGFLVDENTVRVEL
jgi:flagella basal body P-ring formation protein FlgA